MTVFADGPGGGNPAPIVLDAAAMADEEMRDIARGYGHESAFVVDPSGTGCNLALRFWVPNHEMEMCGHAALGAVWLLADLGALPVGDELTVHTGSGVVRARIAADHSVSISQPPARVEAVPDTRAVLAVLGLRDADLCGRPVRNATTSRTKTLVPVGSADRLDAIEPDWDRVEGVCAELGSTGLYPYAFSGDRQWDARQFPRSSGYPEDPATGIAAASLVFGLLADGLLAADGRPVAVRQGRVMGRPSRISVQLEVGDTVTPGCWLSGRVSHA